MNVNTNPDLLRAFKREMFEHQLEALDQARDSEGAISPEEARLRAHLANLSARFFRHDLAVNDNTIVNCFLEQEIERQSLGVAPGTAAWNTLARHGKQVMQQVFLADARRYRGDYDDSVAFRALGLPRPSEVQGDQPRQRGLGAGKAAVVEDLRHLQGAQDPEVGMDAFDGDVEGCLDPAVPGSRRGSAF
jgi:hypothetical protein